MKRQAEHALASPLGTGECSRRQPEGRICGLQMYRPGIMHNGFDLSLRKLRDSGIAVVSVNHELVVNTFISRVVQRYFQPCMS